MRARILILRPLTFFLAACLFLSLAPAHNVYAQAPTIVDATIGTGPNFRASKKISHNFFGGNFLIDHGLSFKRGTSVTSDADPLGISLWRYSGGAAFDITRPNSDPGDPDDMFIFVPLNDFLDHAAAQGKKVSLTLPTDHYKDLIYGDDGEVDQTELRRMRAELEDFLIKLIESKSFNAEGRDNSDPAYRHNYYGVHSAVKILEIGNEDVRAPSRSVDARSYTSLFIEMMRVIVDVYDRYEGVVTRPLIAVQAQSFIYRPTISDDYNRQMISRFKREGLADEVDVISIHSYPRNLRGVTGQVNHVVKSAKAWIKAGIGEAIYLSEWHGTEKSRSKRKDPNWRENSRRMDNGARQGVTILEAGYHHMKNGIDYAAVWPSQHHRITNKLTDLTDHTVYAPGSSYALMSSALPGAWALKNQSLHDVVPETREDPDVKGRYRTEVLTHAFETEDKLIVFVSSWDIDDLPGGAEVRLDVDRPAGASPYRSVEITRLTYGDVDRRTLLQSNFVYDEPQVTMINAQDGEDLTELPVRLTKSYEVVRLIFRR